MQLNSRQLSILDQIGIPVWELRGQNVGSSLQEREVLTGETKIQCQQSWIVVVEKIEANSAKQSLLYAMLKAINVSYDDVAVITSNEYPMLDLDATNNKLVLVLGRAALSCIDGISESFEHCRGKIHQTDIDTVVSYGLDELLNNPHKKAAVWQDLLFAKSHYEKVVLI